MKQDRLLAAYENIAREVERLSLLVQESQRHQQEFIEEAYRILQAQSLEAEEARLKVKLNLNAEVLKKLDQILKIVMALLALKQQPAPEMPAPTPEPYPVPGPETPEPAPAPAPETPEQTPVPEPIPLPDAEPGPEPAPEPKTIPAPTKGAPGEVGSVPMPTVQEGTGRLRVIHASPDAPAVDVYVQGQQLLANVGFGQVSSYAELPVGRYRVQVFPAGKMAGAVIDTNVDVKRNKAYTVAATGLLNNIRSLLIDDEPGSAPAGLARLKVVHLSPNTPAVDVTATTGQVLVPTLTYRGRSGYLQVRPGVRGLQLRPAGKQDIALQLPSYQFDGNKVYTLFVIGLAGQEPMVRPLLVPEEA